MKTKILTAVLAFVGLFSLIAAPIFANHSAFAENICDMTEVSSEIRAASGCPPKKGEQQPRTISEVVQTVLNIIIGALGLVAVAVIVFGGVQYMTSTGDSGKTAKARNTILYAVIGLIICAFAAIIVNWTIGVLNQSGNGNNSNNTSIESQHIVG